MDTQVLTSILKDWGAFGGIGIFIIVSYRLIRAGDSFFSDGVKRKLAERLLTRPTEPWSRIVIEMHDALLVGQRHSRFILPRFGRVFGVSIGSATVIFLILLMSSSSFRDAMQNTEHVGLGQRLLLFGCLFFVLNPVVDYCSVVETRFVLRWMDACEKKRSLVALGILDAALTLGLMLILFPFMMWVFGLGLEALGVGLHFNQPVCAIVVDGLLIGGKGAFFALYCYTTVVTSVWIWSYAAVEFAFRLSPMFRIWFPIEKRPFQSVAVVFAAIATLSVSTFWMTMAVIRHLARVIA